MRLPLVRGAWLAASLLLAACSSTPPVAAPMPEPAPVLLVSIDGLRADYLDLDLTPHLSRLAREGVRAKWMTPSYPSLTFPNHYTLVTGLRPDRHGIVHNTMGDAALGGFKLSDREAVGNPGWWGGEPLWVTAQKAGMPTATLFWPGSEAPVAGLHPTRWKPFDEHLPYAARVDEVVAWMGEAQATRPRLATLYLERLDEESHSHGPGSPQARAALVEADAAIGRLLRGLDANGMIDRVNLVVTSDHGMAEVPPHQVVAVEDMADPADATAVTTGQSVGFEPLPGRTPRAEAQLLGRHAQYQCWRRHELPARWHYGRNPRVPPIVCQMDEGWDALRRASMEKNRRTTTRGSHGYDPALESMRAIFIARGPAFRRGVVLPPFDNVDVYPLLARLVGVTPVDNDGDPATLLPALAER
jgi:predicted AlkP superfamily pyrophosphatase or phosphodiesterase